MLRINIKRNALLFVCALMLTLTGCGSNENGNTAKTNEASVDSLAEKSSPARQYSEGNIGLLEGDGTIYWYDAVTCLMNYLDESDMSWHVLCGKPDCTHTVEKGPNNSGHVSDCNAFIECLFYTPLGYYDGRIYYVEGVITLSDRWISSIKADGTDHKRETEIEYHQNTAGTQYYFHYGRLYELNSYMDKDSVVSIYTLNDMKKSEVSLDGFVEALYPKENFIYYYQSSLEDLYSSVDKRMDLYGKVADLEIKNSGSSIGAYYSNNAVYCFSAEKGLYKVEYDSDKVTVLWDDMDSYSAPYYYLFSDGQYIYLRASGEEVYFQGDQNALLVFDMDGKLVREMEIVNTDEATKELKAKISATTDETLKKEYQSYISHINDSGLTGGYDAFYGSIGGYIFSGNYAMPNQYIKVEELTSGGEMPQWKDTTFID